MKCPYCGALEDKVIDSRPTDESETIRRRRECARCLKRFTTYEKVEIQPLVVIKKDHSRENFNRDKLMRGISRACEKRPIATDEMHKIVDQIETRLSNSLEREVTSQSIGELLMDELKKLDQVAYVRFASVYRDFSDIDTFLDEIHKIRTEENPGSGINEGADSSGSARMPDAGGDRQKIYDKPYEKTYEKPYEKPYDKQYEKPYEKADRRSGVSGISVGSGRPAARPPRRKKSHRK